MENKDPLSEFLALVQVDNFEEKYSKDITGNKYFGMPLSSIIACENRLKGTDGRSIAYFSMEYGLATSFYNTFSSAQELSVDNKMPENTIFSNYRLADYFFDIKLDKILDLPIYSGGLGVLAGDTAKTMADYKLPAVAVGILWHCGYFRQKFWFKYGQVPEKTKWDPYAYPGLIPLKNIVKIRLKGEEVNLKLWKYYVYSHKHDYAIPLVLLDADIEQNSDRIKDLTEQLYRSDNAWIKIMQRIVLGFGGVAALRELGYNIDIFHLNEGHAVFSFVEKARGLSDADVDKLKSHFVYTCHTPVEAGHDRFGQDDLKYVLEKEDFSLIQKFGTDRTGMINLTLLAMNTSSSVNAVSKNHMMVMCKQFPKYKDSIKYVTNGVHPYTWMSANFINVLKNFPKVFADIEENPMLLSKVSELKSDQDFRRQIWQAHQASKSMLCKALEKWQLKEDVFTICWARRIAAYKRPSLILYDIEKLKNIASKIGPIQLLLAGKSHPNDNLGFTFVNEMMDKVDKFSEDYDKIKIIFLENYDMYMGMALTRCVDVWLNNPLPPYEASGTSGMKAILNAVLQLTTLDGWVVEAEDKGIGKIFGYKNGVETMSNELDLHMQSDSNELYASLEELVALYYKTNNKGNADLSSRWIDMMINCIETGSYFNTYRMLDEYKRQVWRFE
ncbi:MAG: alpha-glucan family phosphorylase [Candidatus Omnitrophica bacterium]|nr:alpha-glucan family phosphorylase [Candidatus Omnitrophota bacterium]